MKTNNLYAKLLITLFFMLFLASMQVYADDLNDSVNLTVANLTITDNITVTENITVNDTNLTTLNNTITNQTSANETNSTNITKTLVKDWNITRIVPESANIGDVSLNIQVENTGDLDLSDLNAMIKGTGFSMYSQETIDSLSPRQKSYIIVAGKFEKSGEINLSIQISGKTFYKTIVINDPTSKEAIEDQIAKEKELSENLSNLSAKLSSLQARYDALDKEYETKKSANYDVSDIKLDDMKLYLRDAQKSIIAKDITSAQASLTLAEEEAKDIGQKLNDAKIIKKTMLQVVNENAVLLSTIAGAIVALITLYEILKKKKEGLYKKIKEMQVDKNTKIVVEQKSGTKEESK